MVSEPLPTDSFLLCQWEDGGSTEWPAVEFPEFSDEYLGQFVAHLWSASDGDAPRGLEALSVFGVHTLAAALARAAGLGENPQSREAHDAGRLTSAAAATLAELRTRDCAGLGDEPTGPELRGRLLQLIGAFTSLHALGITPHQRQKLRGACPFCNGTRSLQVSLPAVSWRCFACQQGGGIREFAECLLLQVLEYWAAPERLP